MRIVLSNSAGKPIYEQIKDQVKDAILSGQLTEGEALPSIRQLARELKISVITTTRAYSDLEAEGFVASVQGKGCFVLGQNSELVREQALRDVEAGLGTAITAARLAKIDQTQLHQMLDVLLDEGSE